jgi:hypothetical protein
MNFLLQVTQDEVLRSISDNVGASVDGNKLLATFCAAAATLILVALIAQRRRRQIAPKALNHPGRLLKEVGKSLAIKPEQMKKIKQLAEQKDVHPLTLMLCPSLLSQAMKKKQAD